MNGELYLLDTNILVHFVRNDSSWAKVRDEFQLFAIEPTPWISVVTSGELRSLAYQHSWGSTKSEQMEFALGYFVEIPIQAEKLVRAYALIDAHFQKQGQALGKNDLWIAATAHITGAKLLTMDHDFDAMHGLFLNREWIDPSHS
jgi:tRNA(fMet)-specific endonuclease VapC